MSSYTIFGARHHFSFPTEDNTDGLDMEARKKAIYDYIK